MPVFLTPFSVFREKFFNITSEGDPPPALVSIIQSGAAALQKYQDRTRCFKSDYTKYTLLGDDPDSAFKVSSDGRIVCTKGNDREACALIQSVLCLGILGNQRQRDSMAEALADLFADGKDLETKKRHADAVKQ